MVKKDTLEEKNLEVNEENLEVEKVEIKEENPIDEANLTKKEKRKLKKEAKRRKKFFFESDIKYKGPLSYRYLRIIAWMSLAVSQIILLNSISGKVLPAPLITSEGLEFFISAVGALSVPLFFMATFATILNKNKSFKSVIIFYAAAYLAIAFGFMIFYLRYVDSVLDAAAVSAEKRKGISVALSDKAQVNVFADLLALALFFFFLNYKPTKYFQTKKLHILFRSFCIVPLLVAAGSYAVNIMVRYGVIEISFLVAPFLTTKPPVVYGVFILIAIWMKRREKKYYKMGGTEEGYANFEKSNRNSLAFGVVVSVLFLIFSVIDFTILLVGVYLAEYAENASFLATFLAFDGGAASGLFFAIPFMLLFSYNKTHKPSSVDLLIVLAGIAMVAFVFLEMGRDILVILFKSGNDPLESLKMFLTL